MCPQQRLLRTSKWCIVLFNKHSLITRLTLLLSLTTLLFSVIYAKLYYRHVFEEELARANGTVMQIGKTVSSTASIAAYLEDKDLATEVVNGLISNDIILSAALVSKDTLLAKSILHSGPGSIQIKLVNPFFLSENIGMIHIAPNTLIIEQNARSIALGGVKTMLVVILPIIILLSTLVYWQVTRPLNQLGRSLAKILPGSAQRLKIDKHASHNEIGRIELGINTLLDKAEALFEQERSLRAEVVELEKRFRLMFEQSSSPTLLVKDEGDILLINDAAKDLLVGMGIDVDERFPENLGLYCKTPDILYTFTENSIKQKQVMQSEFEFINPLTQSTVWLSIIVLNTLSDGQWYFQVFLADITLRKTMLNQLNKRAQRDSLTGLYNRYGAELMLLDWIDNQCTFSLLLIDLDKFKPINDVYGHNAGDALLKHIANQLSVTMDTTDLVCRWGGDEFLVARLDITQQELTRLAQTLLEAINQPMPFEHREGQTELAVGASIGIAHFPQHAENLKGLVECADVAMYSIKKTSRNSFTFYSE